MELRSHNTIKRKSFQCRKIKEMRIGIFPTLFISKLFSAAVMIKRFCFKCSRQTKETWENEENSNSSLTLKERKKDVFIPNAAAAVCNFFILIVN